MTDGELIEVAHIECSKLLKSEKGYNGISFPEFWAEGYKKGFDEGYKKATERAYERQQDLTDTYIKDGEKIKQLEKENVEMRELIETQYAENQTLGNNNATLLHLYGECHKENTELKAFCKKLIKTNSELRNSLRKYEIVPDVDYLPDGTEVYKENVGSNPYGSKQEFKDSL